MATMDVSSARTTFTTSREMDFFSEKELVTQTGHSPDEWPLVIVKELFDNSLDACEESDVAPCLEVRADETGITVSDNGPGLPDATIDAVLDFTLRVSSREAVVAPDRGAQGNALKTLVALPYVVDSAAGGLIVTSHGVRRTISCRANPITQCPQIQVEREQIGETTGTSIRLEWSATCDRDGDVLWPFDGGMWPCYDEQFADRFRWFVESFAVLNPHLTLELDWFGQGSVYTSTNPHWNKWKPHKPSSAHWYGHKEFERLIAAYVAHDRAQATDRTVADLIATFDGLSSSRKRTAVLENAGLKRASLSQLVKDGELDNSAIAALLSSMQDQTKPITPKRLGCLGEDHLRSALGNMGVLPESFKYKRIEETAAGLPSIIETAFGWFGDEADERRRIVTGVNWSPGIKNPFRSFGRSQGGLESLLTDLRAGEDEPIVFVLHVAHPRVEYTDRGKSALVLSDCYQG